MATRSVSLSYVTRTGKPGVNEVRLLVLDERTGDVVTDLALSPQQHTDLLASRVIRVEEVPRG